MTDDFVSRKAAGYATLASDGAAMQRRVWSCLMGNPRLCAEEGVGRLFPLLLRVAYKGTVR
jgi:hypothetical protein